MSTEDPSSPRVVIIGLDGATFDLILPWIKTGKLPFIAKVLDSSSYGPLSSTHPPSTFPAWTTFMTGKNPGKHGIYDFTQHKEDAYGIQFVNSTFRKGKTLWQLLSECGKRVGVLGLPATYPPEPINGFIISGFDSPVTTGIDSSFTYPRELYRELKKRLGPYIITDFQELRIGKGWHEDALDKILSTLERKAAYANYLIKKESWDCFMVLFGESDTVSHHFWMFHDQKSPRYDPRASARLHNAIFTVYRKLDEVIGDLITTLPEDTCIILLSDHGFGGAGDKVIYLNRWLEQNGYFSFKGTGNLFHKTLNWSKKAALEVLPSNIQEQFFRRGSGRVASTIESLSRFGHINWGCTQAFSEELNYFPNIWINLKGREPQGMVEPGRTYELLRDEIIEKLSGFTDRDTNEKIVHRAYKREELYQGGQLEKAPDIILELNCDQGYSYSLLPSRVESGKEILRTLGEDELMGAKGKSMNGSHRMEGILTMKGPSILKGKKLEGSSLLDLTPTILHLLNCPLPLDLDGQVIENAFEKDFFKSHPIRYNTTGESNQDSPPKDLTDDEEANLRERLKDMGYF
jgi:predicted AlkP superfamily phosphohydrolase/phosphomutase